MSDLKRASELDEPPYDYHSIKMFENVASNLFTHVEAIWYDSEEDEIVLLSSVEITGEREQIFADQLQDVAEQLGWSFTVSSVTDETVRVRMPSTFKYE